MKANEARIMAQSTWMFRFVAAFGVAMTLALLAAPRASGNDVAAFAAEGSDAVEREARSPDRRAAEERLRARGAALDEGEERAPVGWGLPFASRSGLLGTALLAFAFYFVVMRGRGGAAGASSGWGSYYLFWIAAPALLAVISAHPGFLVVIVIGLLARRWLPDPILFLKHQGRVRSLQADIDANPANATARRDLAKIWLVKHRPRRALPLLEEAMARDPDSIELLFLWGVAHLLAGHYEKAVAALVGVAHREPNFQYGDAYLRAADALMALGRWDDADDALERYVRINSSSMEGQVKRVRVCNARNDREGARKAVAELRHVWRTLPAYQRRRQLGWYLRSLF
jgi:tetratricopeptide (TPR) repeat protein